MWEVIVDFFTAVSIWELAIILFFKIIEVSIGTLRIILISKGYRRVGTILAFFEIALWVFVASTVITGLASAPIKGVVYSFGFAIGVYTGSRIENRLAFGKQLVQAITTEPLGTQITNELRELGYGVTTVKARGKDNEKTVLMIYVNRKGSEKIIDFIKEKDEHAMIVANDLSTISGGYISSSRRSQLIK